MNWLVWLSLAVVLAAVAAVTGIKPKGTRHVSHTRMMGMGRIALVIIVRCMIQVPSDVLMQAGLDIRAFGAVRCRAELWGQ